MVKKLDKRPGFITNKQRLVAVSKDVVASKSSSIMFQTIKNIIGYTTMWSQTRKEFAMPAI
jgi:hypothetical protein